MPCLRMCDKSRRRVLQKYAGRGTIFYGEPYFVRFFTNWHALCIGSSVSRVTVQDIIRYSFSTNLGESQCSASQQLSQWHWA
jgi:hypothetical protein